ncbi:hypothetical protein C3E97_031520, partial [Pseudomonas sp. MWU12-2115]
MAFKRAFKAFNFSVQGVLSGVGGQMQAGNTAINNANASIMGELQVNVENRILRSLLFGVGTSAYDVGAFDAVQRLGGLMSMSVTTTLNMLVCEKRSGSDNSCDKSTANESAQSGMVSNAVKSIAGGGMADVATMVAKSAVMAGTVLTMLLPSLPTIYFVLMTLEWVIWLVVAAL